MVSCDMVEKELNELGSSMEDRLAGREFCEGAELTALDSGNTRVTKASSWLVVNSALCVGLPTVRTWSAFAGECSSTSHFHAVSWAARSVLLPTKRVVKST